MRQNTFLYFQKTFFLGDIKGLSHFECVILRNCLPIHYISIYIKISGLKGIAMYKSFSRFYI